MTRSDVFDVRDWGAKADRLDNEVPINACLAAAKTAGAAIKLSEMYLVAGPVKIPGGVEVFSNAEGDEQHGIKGTWNDRSNGPAVVGMAGRGATIRNVAILGAHDGTPTAEAGASGVSGLIVQGAEDFVVDRVVSSHHSQMGIRIVGSSNGRLISPTAQFCGRDGITLYGQGEMSDIEILRPTVYQTGDDGIAVWDGSARFDVDMARGSIEAGSAILQMTSSIGLKPGDGVLVQGADAGGAPLAADVVSSELPTSFTLSVQAQTTVKDVDVANLQLPRRIRIVDAVVDQNPVHTTHLNRNGRGIVVGGARQVRIERSTIRNSVSIGLHLRHGSVKSTSGLAWNRDLYIGTTVVEGAGLNWPGETKALGSIVLGRTVGLHAADLSVRQGVGHGLVLRDLVDAMVDGGSFIENRLHGIVGLERSLLRGVSIQGASSLRNGKDSVADPGGKLRLQLAPDK